VGGGLRALIDLGEAASEGLMKEIKKKHLADRG